MEELADLVLVPWESDSVSESGWRSVSAKKPPSSWGRKRRESIIWWREESPLAVGISIMRSLVAGVVEQL